MPVPPRGIRGGRRLDQLSATSLSTTRLGNMVEADPIGPEAPRAAVVSEPRTTREPLTASWLAAIVESSSDAIASKTLDGIVTSWNPAAERLFGYSAEEMIGRPIAILAAPDRENEMPAILERIRRGEKVEHYETVRRRKDGSLVDISLTVSPVRDGTGRIVGASKIARDITAHKRAEQALLKSEERFRNLANTVPDIVWTTEPDGTITFANDRWFEYCGITPEQNARGWPELVLHPDDRERCFVQWTRALREGTEYEIEVRNRRYDGEYRWFLTRATPVRDGLGRIIAWVGSTTDIHDRRQAEERQRMLTAELLHRVKNTLAVVQVLAERSAARASSVADCIEAFRGRLRALSAAHDALIAGDWNWASLPSLVRTALEPYFGEADRIRLDDQDLRLDPTLALTLALGLHELATNAAKYGALCSPSGRIALIAHIHSGEDSEELRMVWQEFGGPVVNQPAVTGFGITMLSQAIECQHKGRVELDWRKEGLICRLALPLKNATSSQESSS
jgi:PAS domain S-box-containing protein